MDENKKNYDKIDEAFFIVQHKYTVPFTMTEHHYHNAYEIYYMLEGERYYFIKDTTYLLKKGDMVIIDINELHRTIDAGVPTHERILINFKKGFLGNIVLEARDFDLLSGFKKNRHFLRLSPHEQDFVMNLFQRMKDESSNMSCESKIYTKLLLAELLILISRKIACDETVPTEHLNPAHRKISEIVAFINENYVQRLTLEQLSERFFISSYYLSRIFKECTGFSFIEYLNSVRTKEACKLLTETKFNITEISEKVGYESITHFGRTFKTILGISPREYRRKMLKL